MNERRCKARKAAVFFLSALISLLVSLPAAAGGLGAVKSVKKERKWMELECENGKMRISRVGDSIIHIRATDEESFSGLPSFAVEEDPGERAPSLLKKEETIVLDAGGLEVVIDPKDSRMDILTAEGWPVVTERSAEGTGIYFSGREAGCVKVMPKAEHYYGFGEKTGPLDKRGEKMVMWNSDAPHEDKRDPLYQSHPFFIGVRQGRAYGLFFDNPRRTEFDMGGSREDRFRFSAEDGEVDYWVIYGPSPGEVLSRYGRLAGTMNLPPLWGIGYHQCRWSYKTEKRVREIAEGFKKHELPLDAIYLDIHYMDGYRVFTFNEKRFPDPGRLFADLEAQGIKTVVIVDPGVKIDPDYYVYRQGMENDYFVRDEKGGLFTAHVWPGKCHFPDFYRPEVREWWAGLHKFYADLGVDGIWNDMNEPAGAGKALHLLGFYVPLAPANWRDMRHGKAPDLVPHEVIHNVYALLEAKATYAGLLQARPDERPFIISRGGYSGIQRYALVWTGDNFATWPAYRTSIPMLLNMGMSGLAFVGADIGGFTGHPSKELFIRWMQLGMFYPFCRNHTVQYSPDQEPWAFGKEALEISRDYMNLRYRLLPYTYALFREAAQKNHPVMRPLVFEFPGDEEAAAIEDQFMWGPFLMVAPVMEKRARTRSVYFPQGEWFDFYSGKKFTGPGRYEVEAPLSRLPLFARAGALIPAGPAMKHTGEKPWDPLTLLAFPGPEPSGFILYEDDGKSFAYQKGEYAETAFRLVPERRGYRLEINPLKRTFDPRREKIIVKIFGMDPAAEALAAEGKGTPKPAGEVSYDKNLRALTVSLPDHGKKITLLVR